MAHAVHQRHHRTGRWEWLGLQRSVVLPAVYLTTAMSDWNKQRLQLLLNPFPPFDPELTIHASIFHVRSVDLGLDRRDSVRPVRQDPVPLAVRL